MASKREAITFENRNGLKLFGILHHPEPAKARDIAIILLSPGVKMRVGPHRLYIKMTEKFLEMGYTVFRFDFYGLGDSEGELTEELLMDAYNHIEVGRYIDDSLDSMDWMQKEYGFSKFILSGLCGGAITGQLTAERDDRVVGLLHLGITAVLASSAADPASYITAGQLDSMRTTYISKILKPKAWLRLLTFQSDYRILWRSLTQPVKKKLGLDKKPKPPQTQSEDETVNDNSNPLFAPAFFKMLETGRPMLLVFSGADRLYWEFQEKFEEPRAEQLAPYKSLYEIHSVENANHVFSFKDWQQEMLDVSVRWLQAKF